VNYPVPVSDFTLARVTVTADQPQAIQLSDDNLVLCTQGSVNVAGHAQSAIVNSGEAAYVGQEADLVHLTGDGVVFIASNGTGVTL